MERKSFEEMALDKCKIIEEKLGKQSDETILVKGAIQKLIDTNNLIKLFVKKDVRIGDVLENYCYQEYLFTADTYYRKHLKTIDYYATEEEWKETWCLTEDEFNWSKDMLDIIMEEE